MSELKEPSRAQQLVGDFAPRPAELTDEVLFGDVWARAELSPRDRSLITVAALIANGNTEQLPGHLTRARENGITEAELAEVMTHLALAHIGFKVEMGYHQSSQEISGHSLQVVNPGKHRHITSEKLFRPVQLASQRADFGSLTAQVELFVDTAKKFRRPVQKPSIVLQCTSRTPSPSSSRAHSFRE